MQHTSHRLLKWLGCLALGCYVFLAVAFLGVRYWVLPNVDRWREPIQRELSEMLSAQVELGGVSAEWRGRHPRLHIRDATLRDTSARSLLEIPELDIVISWRSLLAGQPRFRELRADGVELSLRRDSRGRLRILGRDFDNDREQAAISDDASGELDVLQWLSRQGRLKLTNASVRWLDETRAAPPLQLSDVSLDFGIQGDTQFFAMRALPPAALGTSFSLQGRAQRQSDGTGSAVSLADVSGLLHVRVEGMKPAGWAPWLDVRSVLERGEVDWQGWQEVADGVPQRHVSMAEIKDGAWKSADGASVQAASAQLYLAGPWAELNELFATEFRPGVQGKTDPEFGVRIALRLHDLSVSVPAEFEAPLQFQDIALSGGIAGDSAQGLQLHVDRAQVRNADMDLELQGGWRQHGGGKAGLIDAHGIFTRAELAAIVRYLPSAVGDEARDWLHHGLLAGRLTNAQVFLKGDLIHFPFGDLPGSGDFYVGGDVHGAIIDYAPASQVGPPGWPRIEQLHGHAQLHRADLKIRAERMYMRPDGKPIALRHVHAHISDIEEDSVLDVHGTGRADARALISLIQTTPLGRLLEGLFNDATGHGECDVPIALNIPLFDTEQTRVAGSVVFRDAGLALSKTYPALTGLNGAVSFTEEVMTAKGLKANVLGGPVVIEGGVGKGQKGMSFEGRVSADALAQYVGSDFKGMLEGSTSYLLSLQRNVDGAFGLRLDAPLEGMALLLPAPLAKPASEKRPLRVQWTSPKGKASGVLEAGFANGASARLLHRAGKKGEPFFYAGAINLGGKAQPGASGLALDIHTPQIDIDAWRELASSLEGEPSESPVRGGFLPPVRDLRLQSERARVLGTDLDHLTFTARQSDGQRWRVDVSSTQTAGTLFWQERQGRIQGDVEAHFQRLAVGTASADDSAQAQEGGRGRLQEQERGEQQERERAGEPGREGVPGADTDEPPLFKLDEKVNIPAVRLNVDRLSLYGREVGSISLVGVNEAQGRIWKLEQLNLKSPHASLKGSGVWRLEGPERGLRIQASALFDDLGSYLEHAGFKAVMQGGHGQVEGYIEWRDIPWRFERSALQGDLQVDLAKGRLLNLGSRSARLLELLSLQSVKRLATLEWNPAGLIKQGFPFDTLQGHIKINEGVLHSENYRVAGPVGTIVIAGDVDLPKEALDLYAVVVPNLDVSGAAIAAGIAVNPIVGLGAFLTQWLLKDPLSKAMAVEYRIKGDLDDPQIDAVTTSPKQ